MGRIRGKIGRRNIIHVKTEEKAKSRFCASLLRKKLHLTVCGTFFYTSYNISTSQPCTTPPPVEGDFCWEEKRRKKYSFSGLTLKKFPKIIGLVVLYIWAPQEFWLWGILSGRCHSQLKASSKGKRDSYEEESDITLVSQELITFF